MPRPARFVVEGVRVGMVRVDMLATDVAIVDTVVVDGGDGR